MNRKLAGNIARFVLLALAQIFVFNKIQVTGYISPQVYVLFILMLPFEITGFWLLSWSFAMGLTVDFFMHTPGMHAAAAVTMAFLRPGVIRLVGKKDDVEPWQYPNVRDSGAGWFLAYTLILVFLQLAHHCVESLGQLAHFARPAQLHAHGVISSFNLPGGLHNIGYRHSRTAQ